MKRHYYGTKDHRIAKDPNTSAVRLALYASHLSEEVRAAVAGNESTTDEVLEFLKNDEYLFVRLAVAQNNNTTELTLKHLEHDKCWLVRDAATKALRRF